MWISRYHECFVVLKQKLSRCCVGCVSGGVIGLWQDQVRSLLSSHYRSINLCLLSRNHQQVIYNDTESKRNREKKKCFVMKKLIKKFKEWIIVQTEERSSTSELFILFIRQQNKQSLRSIRRLVFSHCKPDVKTLAPLPRILQQQNEDLQRRLSHSTHKMEAMEAEFDGNRHYMEAELSRTRDDLDKMRDKFRRWELRRSGSESDGPVRIRRSGSESDGPTLLKLRQLFPESGLCLFLIGCFNWWCHSMTSCVCLQMF